MDARALRARFPVLTERAYLNAGTCGPVPLASRDARTDLLDRFTRDGRDGDYFAAWNDVRARLRTAYANLLGAQAPDVALTTCTSEGITRVLQGIGLQRGDEILTAPDEHPGLLGPLAAIRRDRGVRIVTAPLARIGDAVTPRTRLVACSHVGWMTGEVAPDIPEGPLVLLDGAQAVGAIDVDVTALRCDYYAGPGQKWLCGPVGTGMLWINPTSHAQLACPSPTYVDLAVPADGLDAVPAADASRHDAPAISAGTWLGALAAYEVLADAGWPAVHQRATTLAAILAHRLAADGRTVGPRGPTTLVSWEDPDPEGARVRLADAGVTVRNLPGTAYLRASVGAWNDEEDLERLHAAL